MTEVRPPREDSTPSDGASLFGKSAVLEFEESHQIEADLKLRDVQGPKTSGTVPTFRTGGSRYELLGTIGAGGMGNVLLAYDHDLKRRVAIKILRHDLRMSPAQVRRFLEEAQATGQLEHPNIVPVYDVGRAPDGQAFYTMRFVQGASLEGVLRLLRKADPEARAEYTVTRFLQILEQVSMAVHFAHEKGVVHRDLKPANIMLGDYGEVFVMDWGLARIVSREEPSPRKKVLVGTPAYMSPEQAAGLEAGPRSDIFALGVILFKCLTLRAPFHGLTLEALLADIRRAQPAAPRRFNSRLPIELDRIALKALAREPDDRFQTARAFRDALQSLVEGFAERRRRRGRAEGISTDGSKRATAYLTLREDLREAEAALRAVERQTPGWLPLGQKRDLIGLRQVVEEKAAESEHAFNDAVEVLSKALGFDPTLASARGALAELYYRRFIDAEAEGDLKQSRFFRRLVEAYHDGRYKQELRGEGQLVLDSDPSGSEVFIYEYRESEMVLVPDNERYLGKTPLQIPLPIGSYLVVLRRNGFPDIHYPVLIRRLGEWRGEVRMRTRAQIGEGFVYVPGGPFLQGGDRGTLTSLPRATPTVDDFYVSVYPVTNADYLDFLNDLARTDETQAMRRAPRRGADSAGYWKFGDAGFSLPEIDAEGDRHEHSWPVIAISWHDAVAYCEWRSRRDGRAYTLPSELEWEKAARGVDGRIYPWGDRFDPALCNMKDSRERAGPVAVGTFRTDLSPYGVRDMCGNSEEWTADGSGDSRGSRIARGGSWLANSVVVRCAFRSTAEPHLTAAIRGFRLFSREPAPSA